MTREEAKDFLTKISYALGNMSVEYLTEKDGEKMRDAIKALEQTRWIPVSERLPEKTGIYLISIGDLVTSKSFDGHDFRTESAVRFIPDAWMPLPEPYKAEGSEE